MSPPRIAFERSNSGRRRHRLLAMMPTLFPVLVAGAIMAAAPVLAENPVETRTQGKEAQPRVAPPRPISLGEVQEGTLLIHGNEPGRYLPAPLLHTRLDMQVDGMVARATVTQRFYNPTDNWVEALYAFPLPETAAIDGLRMKVGDRFIEGRVETRAEARKTYEVAKQRGKTATLLEQHRPNLFTNAVANIGPGEEIVVRLAFHQTADYRDGGFSLRFPTVPPQRYIPAARPTMVLAAAPEVTDSETKPLGTRKDGDGVVSVTTAEGWALQPRFQDPAAGKINPFEAEVRLRPGFPLAHIGSQTHKIVMAPGDAEETIVSLAGKGVAADRDFVLRWTPDIDAAPAAALFRQSGPGKPFNAPPGSTPESDVPTYAMVMLMPPRTEGGNVNFPREIVIVLDTSGSMSGPSIGQAKQAVLMAIDRLRPGDRFNVISFNDAPTPFHSETLPATPRNLRKARMFVDRLDAGGGTVMASALELALPATRDDSAHGSIQQAPSLRQVVFVTDGAVGNEQQLFQIVRDRLGRGRLFTVGVGSAPNGYFMRRAARFGRGTFVRIDGPNSVRDQMEDLFRRIESPEVTDIAVRFAAPADTDVEPMPIPDLYHGEPVVVTARLAEGGLSGPVTVTGKTGNKPWTVTLKGVASQAKGISSLWARRRIERLMDSVHDGADPETVKEEVTELALAHHLVSRYTSLVAVDRIARRPADSPLVASAMPVNLPAGWDKRFFNKAVQRAAPKWNATPTGQPTPMESAPPVPTKTVLRQHWASNPITLPRGATPAWLHLILGLGMALLACFALVGRRRVAC